MGCAVLVAASSKVSSAPFRSVDFRGGRTGPVFCEVADVRMLRLVEKWVSFVVKERSTCLGSKEEAIGKSKFAFGQVNGPRQNSEEFCPKLSFLHSLHS